MLLPGGGVPAMALSKACSPAHSRPGTAGKKATGSHLHRRKNHMRFAKLIPTLGVVGIVAMACGGGGTATASPATVPSDLSISSFTQDFSYMPKLKDLVGAGKGMVGVILPDTTSSARYVAFDAPYLKQAFD